MEGEQKKTLGCYNEKTWRTQCDTLRVKKTGNKPIHLHHAHSLPVLLMFLKLPKLFNFHILRLTADREKFRKRREEDE